MADFNSIYVDLNHATSASGILDGRGVIICDSFTKAGSRTNPLNFQQFRDYIYFDHDVTQTFYLKGQITIDTLNSSEIGALGSTSILETPHTKKAITVTNWETTEQVIQNPWSVIVSGGSGTNGEEIYIVSNNDNLEIVNGEIEVTGDYTKLLCGVEDDNFLSEDLDNEDNTLAFVNTKLKTNKAADLVNGEHSLSFLNYDKISIINSNVSNGASEGSIYVDNTYENRINCYF